MPRLALSALLLVVAVLAVYAPALRFDFVSLDDRLYVDAGEAALAALKRGEPGALLHPLRDGNWVPLTLASHALDAALFGSDPAGPHAVNVLLHALSSVLVLLVLARATGAPARSLAVAALFALHPLRVESVAWVAERKDVLCVAGSLACLLAYSEWTRRGGRARYGAALGLYVLALLSKPMAVSVPFLLLIFDAWPLQRLAFDRATLARRALEKLPFAVLAAGVALVTWISQERSGAMEGAATLPLLLRLQNAVHALGIYVGQTLWPVSLSVSVPHPLLPGVGGQGISWLRTCADLALVAGVSAGVWRWRRAYAVAGWMWFAVALMPVIGIVQVGTQGHADRYTYLPQLGLLWLAVWGASELLGSSRLARRVQLAAGVALGLLCAAGSAVQLQAWRGPIELQRHALRVDPGNLTAHYDIAGAYRARAHLDLAAAHYAEVLRRHPTAARAHNGLGALALERGQFEQAIEHLRRAISLQPDLHLAWNQLGNAERERGDVAAAERAYRSALRHRPRHAVAHRNLAELLAARGAIDEAVAHYRAALELRPDVPRARDGLEAALRAEARRLD